MKKHYFLTLVLTVLFSYLGISQTPIHVKGKLIEIYTAAPNGPVYPKPVSAGPDDFFPASIPVEIYGKEFATSMPENGVGPNQVSGDAGRYVIAAVDNKTFSMAGWVDLNISFIMRDDATPRNIYYLFRLDITETDKWYDIPQQTTGDAPTLLFADQGDVKWVDFNPIEGVIVAEKAPSTGLMVDPSICVLPNGNLMALAKGALPKRQFLSTDGGLTWTGYGPDTIQIRFATPFTHNGVLYMLSSFDFGGSNGIFIRKSLDNGQTWEMYGENNYVLLNGTVLNGALNCPSPVIVSNGRIWRAMGDNGPDDFPNLGLMSAPVDADLMNPSSWTYTNTVARGSSQGRYGGILKPWEPCAIETRDGYPVILSRTNPADARNGDSSPLYRATSETNLTFVQEDVIDLIGAKDKFCIRYDATSDKYWAMTNVAQIAELGAGNSIWSRRNHLVLQSSPDLINWNTEYIVAHGEDERFHGYQYPYFVFDGNDIIAAIRTAAEYEDGQAERQHDANFLTFQRVRNFRDFLTQPELVIIRKGWNLTYIDAQNTLEGNSPPLSSVSSEWVQIDLENGYFAYKKYGTDLVLEGGNTGEEIKLMTYDSNNENQQWKKIKADFRHFYLEKRNAPGFVINGGGVSLTLQPTATGNVNQFWEMEVTRSESYVDGRPTVSFEQPAVADSRIAPESDFTVIVNANDSNGTISSVDLYLDDVLIGSDMEAPYRWDGNNPLLQNMAAGYYTLKAIATDNDGEQVATTTTFIVGVGASEIGVQVEGDGFIKRTFANSTEFFTNRKYVILNAPLDFVGFEFLASAGGSGQTNPGVITPLQDGFVYVAAPGGGVAGWDLVSDSNFNYSDGGQTNLYIYQKEATANIPIDIPLITSFPGASVVAKTIQFGALSVDGFDKEPAFTVYPNPVKQGEFYLRLNTADKVDISIFNLEGRLLYSRKNIEGTFNIKTSNSFKSGLYFIKAVTESGAVFTRKIVVN